MRSRDLSSRVSEGQDIIDTRDITARIVELADELNEGTCETCGETVTADKIDDEVGPSDWMQADGGRLCPDSVTGGHSIQHSVAVDDDLLDEYKVLRKVAEDYCGGEGFEDGATLIADHYFEEYAEELADDLGLIKRGATWPNDCIDWKKAAGQLQQDYSSLDYGSTTYWFRS